MQTVDEQLKSEKEKITRQLKTKQYIKSKDKTTSRKDKIVTDKGNREARRRRIKTVSRQERNTMTRPRTRRWRDK